MGSGRSGRSSERALRVALAAAPVDAAECRKLVERVTGSVRFQRSPKLKAFLQFVCERALAEPSEAVHEQQIGHLVYGRRVDYDTGEDNIVRVEARRLRRELEDYFALEGRDEPVVIVIPKGGYAPSFRHRGELSTYHASPGDKPRRRAVWITAMGGGLLLVLAFLSLRSGTSAGRRATPKPAAEARGLWPLVLKPGERTIVIVADGSLAAIQDLSGTTVPLSDYVERRYPNELKSELRELARRQLTGPASLLFVSRIVHLNGGRLDNLAIRHPSSVNIRDFQSDNHILLGSRYSNPWVDLFREKRDFELVPARFPAPPCYTNRSPRPGEQASFCGDAASGEQYGVVAFLPNLSGTGNVLMIEGTTAAGTEAAWQFLNAAHGFEEFVHRHRLAEAGRQLPYFELLLRVRTREGTPVEFAYVTHRLVGVHSSDGMATEQPRR